MARREELEFMIEVKDYELSITKSGTRLYEIVKKELKHLEGRLARLEKDGHFPLRVPEGGRSPENE